eukprot:1666927-Prymnesium_polylepis.1
MQRCCELESRQRTKPAEIRAQAVQVLANRAVDVIPPLLRSVCRQAPRGHEHLRGLDAAIHTHGAGGEPQLAHDGHGRRFAARRRRTKRRERRREGEAHGLWSARFQ